jgi:hypothetical protein
MKKTMKKIADTYGYWVIALTFAIGIFLNFNFQDRINANEGKGFDGDYYYQIAEQLKQGETPAVRAPFVYRVGTPYLASVLPFSLYTNFTLLNYTATLLSSLLLFYWFSLHLKEKKTALVLVLFLMTHWTFYLRYTGFYPTTADPVAFAFILLVLIQMERFRQSRSLVNGLCFSLLVFVGVFFREFLLLFSFGILGYGQPYDSQKKLWVRWPVLTKNIPWFLMVFLLGGLGIFIAHQLVSVTDYWYGFSDSLYEYMYKKSVFDLIAGAFNTFGASLVLIFIFWKTSKEFYNKHHEVALLSLIALSMCWFSGGDTERFFMWFSPLFLIPLGRIIERDLPFYTNKKIWIPLLISMVFTFRMFWSIPPVDSSYSFRLKNSDYKFPLFQAFQENCINLMSYHGDTRIAFLVMLEHIAVCVFILLLYRLKIKQEYKSL